MLKRSLQFVNYIISFPHTNTSFSPLETSGSNQSTYFFFFLPLLLPLPIFLVTGYSLGRTQSLGHLCFPPSLTPQLSSFLSPYYQFPRKSF